MVDRLQPLLETRIQIVGVDLARINFGQIRVYIVWHVGSAFSARAPATKLLVALHECQINVLIKRKHTIIIQAVICIAQATPNKALYFRCIKAKIQDPKCLGKQSA